MAGILDAFGSGPSPYAGLLSPEQNDALRNQGLLAYGAALSQAAMPSRMPIPLGAALGQASMASLQAQNQGASEAAKLAMLQPQIQMTQLKLKEAQDAAKADEAFGQSLQAALARSRGGAAPASPMAPQMPQTAPAMTAQVMPAEAPVPAMAPRQPVQVAPLAGPSDVPGAAGAGPALLAPAPVVAPSPRPGFQSPQPQAATLEDFVQQLPPGQLQLMTSMPAKQAKEYAQKLFEAQREQDNYVPMHGQNGEVIGYQSRKTGKPEYMPAHLSDRYVEEPRNINGMSVPGRKNLTTGKWEALDPTTTKISNTIDQRGPAAGEVQAAKDLSEIGKGFYDDAKTAIKAVGNIKMQKSLLDSGSVATGLGTETAMRISNGLKQIGIEVDPKLPAKEFFQSLAVQMQIGAQPKGQGAVSNFERDLFGQAVTNMGRSTEGNKLLTSWFLKIKEQDAEVSKIYEQELETNKRITPAFLTKVREHYERPIFSKSELEEMRRMANSAPTEQTATPAQTPPKPPTAADPLGLR